MPKTPSPIYNKLEHIRDQTFINKDLDMGRAFLLSYSASADTFDAYRREVERFLQWSLLKAKKPLAEMTRTDLENYIDFCQKPPKSWISNKTLPRFLLKEGQHSPNPAWRPFVAKTGKQARKQGQLPDVDKFQLSIQALQAVFRILSTFFTYLEQEDYVGSNPVKKIRQKSRFTVTHQHSQPIRRLSELQWDYVIETAEKMADQDPLHERTLFIMTALYAMYLRISELVQSTHWSPCMSHFHQDHDAQWWFKTVGKGRKERDISVSLAMLKALKRYRRYLGLTPLPVPGEQYPLLPKRKGRGPINSTRQVRRIVQDCFDIAMERLRQDNFMEEATQLENATVHWLRHTGISDDVKHRPREHVRDDAGHSSSAITDKYIDIGRRARYASAKNKKIRTL